MLRGTVLEFGVAFCAVAFNCWRLQRWDCDGSDISVHTSLKSWDLLVCFAVIPALFGSTGNLLVRFAYPLLYSTISILRPPHFTLLPPLNKNISPFLVLAASPTISSFTLLQSGGFSPAKLRAMLRGLEKHQRSGDDTSPEANDSGELDDRSKSTA
jgi:hypothetical protein